MRIYFDILLIATLIFSSSYTCYSQDFDKYGFAVDAPCKLEKDKQLEGSEARKVGYSGVNLFITFSCLTSTGERGVGTLYRVTYISHDVKVDMDLETYAKEVCKRKESQGLKTEFMSYKGRPACSSRDQAYIRNKVFESGMVDLASGKRSYTLQVLTSAAPLEDKMSIIKEGFHIK